jgi:predicted nucleic acid-binding protein
LILYLETSSLVKLYVREKDSESVRDSVQASEAVATSVLAYAEARAAFARKLREQGITPDAHRTVKRALDADWPSFFVLNVTAGTARSAGDLAEKHGLRGFDALHLASAVELRAAGAIGLRFSSADARLRAAAQAEGLEPA